MKLAYDVVSAPGSSPTKVMVFAHGILGTGVNLRTLAKRIVDARPDWSAVLVDLRAHGKSLGEEGEDTLQQAARDVAETVEGMNVRALVGHSFGGKVALAAIEFLPNLEHVSVIDSGPGTRPDARGSEGTLVIINLMGELEGTVWANREAFVQGVISHGQPEGIARWLAMQLKSTEGGFIFGPPIRRIGALITSYFSLDGWALVERTASHQVLPKLQLIIGERSRIYDESERARVKALADSSKGFVSMELLPAGHWVHVDDLEGLVRALLRWA